MNLLGEFKRGMAVSEYENLLGDQLELHRLHYRKADISEPLAIPKPLKILVITEPWCGDSTAILPVLLRLMDGQPLEFRVLLRDQNPELIDRFLTNGGRAIPILLILDQDGWLRGRFGPRPARVQDIFESHRVDIESGKMERSEVTKKIRTFYAKDRGRTIIEAFKETMNSFME